MKFNIYNGKMFIADLIITSIWSLFAMKSMPWLDGAILAVIVMRLILSFQLYEESDWSGYCAIVFTGLYFITPNHFTGGFSHAVTDMMYYAANVVDREFAHDIILHPDSNGFTVCHTTLWIILSVWLTVLPIISAATSRKLFTFPKWSWINIALLFVTVTAGLYGYTLTYGYLYTSWVILSCFLPEIVWVFRYGAKCSLATELLQNRPLMLYLSFVSLFAIAFVVGFRNVYTLKFIGLIVFPALFYVLLAKSSGVRQIPTFDTIIMSVCGALYWFCMEQDATVRVIALVAAAIITACIGIRLISRTSSRFAGLALLIGVTMVLCPTLLGMNPYKMLDARHTRLYMKNAEAFNGLFVTDNNAGEYGLRDRYGAILPMKYCSIDVLYPGQQNILCCEEIFTDNAARPVNERLYTFFDLKTGKFIEIPDSIPIRSIEEIGGGVFNLYNESEAPVFRLVMPLCGENWRNEYVLIDMRNYSTPREIAGIIPDYANVSTSKDGKVSIYSWNTGLGGTSPDYVSYIKYIEGDSIVMDYFYPQSSSKFVCAKDVKDNGYAVYDGMYVRDMWQYDVPQENPIYIVSAYYRSSSVEGCSMVFAIQFEGGKLIKKQFVTDTGEVYDNVDRMYHIPDWYFLTGGLGPDRIISFDDESKCLYIASNTGTPDLSDRYDVYHYEHGKLFYKRQDAGYWLHPSIRNFNSLQGIYIAEGKIYRIDSTENGYRLVCWEKGDRMSQRPELILTGGKESKPENAIVFTKDEYEYFVPIRRDGCHEDYGKIVIKNKGKVIKELKI